MKMEVAVLVKLESSNRSAILSNLSLTPEIDIVEQARKREREGNVSKIRWSDDFKLTLTTFSKCLYVV
jgi:hypothetical protein